MTRSLLYPIAAYSAWRLACLLATAPRAPHHDAAELDEVRRDLATRRGLSAAEVDEMVALARWAVDVMNPISGRNAESGGTVYQVVADADDLLLAADVAEKRDPAKAAHARALVRRHLDPRA